MTSNDLEKRLTRFSVAVMNLRKAIKQNRIAADILDQMGRSAVSASLNYAEARGAESYKDFSHKTGIVHKELRETLACLRIMEGIAEWNDKAHLKPCLDECDELVSIFVKITMATKEKLNHPEIAMKPKSK